MKRHRSSSRIRASAGLPGIASAIGLALVGLLAAPLPALAGPPDRRPLRPPPDPDRPVPTNERQDLFYMDGDRRVPLFDTGLASVKVRANAEIATSKVALTFPESGSGLADLRESMRRSRLAFVNLDATEGGLKTAASRPEIEWVLPIVETEVATRAKEVPTRLLMTPRIVASVNSSEREKAIELARSLGLEVEPVALRGGLILFRLRDGPIRHDRILEAANRLYEEGRKAGVLRSAQPDFLPEKRRSGDPKDPRYKGQWHLNQSSATGTPLADVDAPEAWATTMGKREIRIAIIDDSVEGTHPDLVDAYSVGKYYDGSGVTTDTNPKPRTSNQRHGTPCAGVAVACANELGGRGIAPNCGLIGIHFWDATISQTADAFRFAADPDGNPATDDGAHVISCSWSWNPSFELVREAIHEVATTARGGKGIPVLFAAGNESGEVEYHQWFGTLPDVICIAASNFEDNHAGYSNYGPTISVCAPSSDGANAPSIDTTDNTDLMPRRFGEDYSGYIKGDYTGTGEAGFGGTSSATPLVAGICGLMLSANPTLTAGDVRAILEHTAERVPGTTKPAAYDPTSGHDHYYGHGRVNAARAVAAAVAAASDPEKLWPAPASAVEVETAGGVSKLKWKAPTTGVDGVLVVQLGSAGWRPQDGQRYAVGTPLPGGAKVLLDGAATELPLSATAANSTLAVFTRSKANLYGWARIANQSGPTPMGHTPASDPGPRPASEKGGGR